MHNKPLLCEKQKIMYEQSTYEDVLLAYCIFYANF